MSIYTHCHSQTSPAAQPIPLEIPTTELVVINSSPGGIGPHPRVRKRKGGFYMLPMSPESPTLEAQRRRQAAKRAKLRGSAAGTRVNAPEIEPLVLVVRIPSSPGLQTARPKLKPLPIFPAIQVKRVSLRRPLSFDPSEKQTSSFSQLLSLDLLPAMGLSSDDFWNLFSKCTGCLRFMTTRTTPYHICPVGDTKCSFGADVVLKTFFLRLLDAHDPGHEAGVPEDVFQSIFYTCMKCGRYMTKRLYFDHNEDADYDDDDDGGEPGACAYMRAEAAETSEASSS